ncbi:hypothetical protein M0805_006914 [Coniferiporia weirii]|nr:hypothetical protein M0805_006914 [Coniferiporia weirii]
MASNHLALVHKYRLHSAQLLRDCNASPVIRSNHTPTRLSNKAMSANGRSFNGAFENLTHSYGQGIIVPVLSYDAPTHPQPKPPLPPQRAPEAPSPASITTPAQPSGTTLRMKKKLVTLTKLDLKKK